MAKFRRAAIFCATSTLIAGALIGATANPASAHGMGEAFHEGCGWTGSWMEIDSENIYNPAGAWMGTVFLTWNNTTKQNCVVTQQVAGHGIPMKLVATLGIRSSGSGAITYRTDSGQYGHFAAVKEYTSGQCVNYRGEIAGSVAGRSAWGNCG
ncbi:hypothetical protein ABZ621_16500 [Streptomyces sp. NPDC007863]|uniref:hypothetical protein n=1 Tax=Streptomyces sp. NPDC007863 TaxID=3154894 RepID=UPI0034114767